MTGACDSDSSRHCRQEAQKMSQDKKDSSRTCPRNLLLPTRCHPPLSTISKKCYHIINPSRDQSINKFWDKSVWPFPEIHQLESKVWLYEHMLVVSDTSHSIETVRGKIRMNCISCLKIETSDASRERRGILGILVQSQASRKTLTLIYIIL